MADRGFVPVERTAPAATHLAERDLLRRMPHDFRGRKRSENCQSERRRATASWGAESRLKVSCLFSNRIGGACNCLSRGRARLSIRQRKSEKKANPAEPVRPRRRGGRHSAPTRHPIKGEFLFSMVSTFPPISRVLINPSAWVRQPYVRSSAKNSAVTDVAGGRRRATRRRPIGMKKTGHNTGCASGSFHLPSRISLRGR